MPTHGNAATYKNGCRCEDCRKASTAYQQAARAKRIARGRINPELIPHGTAGARFNWDCSCPKCVAAHSARCADYKARREAGETR